MPVKKINHSDPTSLLIITTSGEEVMWQPLLICRAACFQNNCQSCERILMTFSGDVDNGTRKTKLYFAEVSDSGGTLIIQRSKAKRL